MKYMEKQKINHSKLELLISIKDGGMHLMKEGLN